MRQKDTRKTNRQEKEGRTDRKKERKSSDNLFNIDLLNLQIRHLRDFLLHREYYLPVTLTYIRQTKNVTD